MSSRKGISKDTRVKLHRCTLCANKDVLVELGR
jgi:hypothetical protein